MCIDYHIMSPKVCLEILNMQNKFKRFYNCLDTNHEWALTTSFGGEPWLRNAKPVCQAGSSSLPSSHYSWVKDSSGWGEMPRNSTLCWVVGRPSQPHTISFSYWVSLWIMVLKIGPHHPTVYCLSDPFMVDLHIASQVVVWPPFVPNS